MEYRVGELARSLAGHDRGCVYLIVRTEGDRVYLCDGRLKKLSAPKKKNTRHIQLIHTGDNPLKQAIAQGGSFNDDSIREFIAAYGGV